MILHYGLILLDETEIIFRIYETSEQEWKLYHYHTALLHSIEIMAILEIIGDFFATDFAQHIAEWKICSRHYPKDLVHEISYTLSIDIEDISYYREQELLCKGMLTELW